MPVLGRILSEYGLIESRIGNLALSSAAVDDVMLVYLISIDVLVLGASWRLLLPSQRLTAVLKHFGRSCY